jgi:multidrug efflux system outer membrane protein
VANADAQVATTAATIPVLQSSEQAAIYSIGVLLGKEPAYLAKSLATQASIPPTPPKVPVGLPSDLLRRRPDIRRAEAQLHAATARIGVAVADLFPKFNITGSLGFAANDLTRIGTTNSKFWSFSPSATWPVFAAGKIVWNIKLQNALQEQALLTYQQTVLTALKEVETALVAYAKEQDHQKALATAVANNRQAVDAAMKLYVAGKTDFLNVLDAQRSLFATEDALTQSTRTLGTDLIALYKALGGGWEQGG